MDAHELTVRETVDARKTRFAEDDLKALFKGAKEVVVTKGKKAETFKPDDEGLAAAALGRSGNLRAPAVRVGKRWLVGYSDAPWETFFDG